jgi:hypothetical protein
MWQLRNGGGVAFQSSFLSSSLDSSSMRITFESATAQATDR